MSGKKLNLENLIDNLNQSIEDLDSGKINAENANVKRKVAATILRAKKDQHDYNMDLGQVKKIDFYES